MGKTEFNTLNLETSSAKAVSALPTAPSSYYGFTSGEEVGNVEWKGGELAFFENKLHVQVNTSGATASWYVVSDTFATTSTTSTTSSTTTTTTTTSTTTSSTTSSSTSTSSTTTAAG